MILIQEIGRSYSLAKLNSEIDNKESCLGADHGVWQVSRNPAEKRRGPLRDTEGAEGSSGYKNGVGSTVPRSD